MRPSCLALASCCALLLGCGGADDQAFVDGAILGFDLGTSTDGGGLDLGAHDGSGGSTDLAHGQSGPSVNLTFSGCSPDFSANVIVVAGNGSMAVTRSDAPLSGQLQLHLTETSGTIAISTAERVAHGDVINLIDGTTYTNISSLASDPIFGTLTIDAYDEDAGIAKLGFANVVVENVQDHTLCTINGTLVSIGKTF